MIICLHKNNLGDSWILYIIMSTLCRQIPYLIVPYYYFIYDKDCTLSNGSMCGNDFDSKRSMARKIIIDSVSYLQNVFLIDGIRLDLMGIIDVETINSVAKLVKNNNKNFLIYGEGWNNSSLIMKQKNHFSNAKKCQKSDS
jgi:pullulanase